MQNIGYNKRVMSFLDKILKMDGDSSSTISNEELYHNLFRRVQSSIKSRYPGIDDKELIMKTEKVYLKMCDIMDCGCLEDIYKPLNDALLSNKQIDYSKV